MKPKTRRIPPAILALILLVAATPHARAEANPYLGQMAAFEAFVAEYMETTGMPGLSVAVMKGDWLWSKGFGLADVENKSPAKAESAYRLASVTKPMTAVAVLMLAQEGKLDLDAEIQTYVPYFSPKKHTVTARQLLGHLGGISHYRNYDLEGHFKDPKTTKEAIAVFADFDLVAEPGTEYHYTSYGYNLLGAAVEGASGMAYGDYMHEKIWRPMGMDATRMDDPYELIANRVRGYRMQNGRLENSEFVDISSRFAAGGTRSTVQDLIKFVQGLASNTVLSPASTELMFTSLANRDGRFTGYGLGWNVAPVNGRPRVTHSGSQAETRTQLTWFPADGFAMAMATNLEGSNLQPLQEKLLHLLFAETWNVPAFVPDPRERGIYIAMASAFRYGVAARRSSDGDAKAGDAKATPEVEAAFAEFHQATDAKTFQTDPEKTLQTLRSGRHPAGDEAWVKMGSYMAGVLTDGDPAAFAALHHGDQMGFFQAYVDRYRTAKPRIPKKLRFSKEVESLIATWAEDWKKVWTPELRALSIGDSTDPSQLQQTLRTALAGRTLVPDYTSQLVDLVENAFQRGQQAEGFALAQLALELYPEAENTNGLWGAVMIITGQVEQGRKHLLKAAAIDSGGYVRIDNLLEVAEFFRTSGATPAARALLEITAEIHPDAKRPREALAALGN